MRWTAIPPSRHEHRMSGEAKTLDRFAKLLALASSNHTEEARTATRCNANHRGPVTWPHPTHHAFRHGPLMSLHIDSRFITGIYALGQWFNVKPNSVDVDAYEFVNWDERFEPDQSIFNQPGTSYQMGDLYPESRNGCGDYGPHSRLRFASCASGYHGITFIDAKTGDCISFSLAEVRAFKERRQPPLNPQ